MGLFESHIDERVVDRNRTVMVTGGTGYIGQHLVRALLRRGFILHVLVRDHSDMGGLEGCNFFLGDVADAASLRPAMENATYVVHLASQPAVWNGPPSELEKVNVQGYENVLHCALEAGIRKVVHVSCALVYGPSDGQLLDEDAVRQQQPLDDFERTRGWAEEVSRTYLGRGLPLTTVYPTAVYGEGVLRDWTPVATLVRLYRRGRLPGLLLGGAPQWNFVHVDDVVSGLLAAMRRPHPGRYVLGGENLPLRDFFAMAARAAGRRAPGLTLPVRVARAWASMEELRARWGGRAPVWTRPLVQSLIHSRSFASRRAEQDLNHRPRACGEALPPFLEWMFGRR